METQRILKERRHLERQKKRDQEIRQKSQTSYVSKGSKQILQKAGVEIARQPGEKMNRYSKSLDDESESDYFIDVEEKVTDRSRLIRPSNSTNNLHI